jgi:predicted AAA+ superfamily ATPase
MATELLHKTSTGIASEFLVAGELARRGYNVTLTFGNTKSIDLLIEKNGTVIPVQVKGMQRKKSICWNINLQKLTDVKMIYVLVNLNADTLEPAEFFILNHSELMQNFKPTSSGRDYLDYSRAVQLGFQNQWEKIG